MGYNFVNPYNFLPLADKKATGTTEGRKLSGSIRYSVYTKTPLMIPDTSKEFIEVTEENKEHKHYVFMSMNDLSSYKGDIFELKGNITEPDAPLIPGSQIRGMLRSVYEMLSNSCLSVLNDDNILSKRTHEVFKAGLLYKEEDGSFTLYAADDCIFRADGTGSVKNANSDAYKHNERTGTWDYCDSKTKSYRISPDEHNGNFHEGQRIYFERTERPRGKSVAKNISLTCSEQSPSAGYLIKGEKGPEMDGIKEKHNCHIFYKKNRVEKTNVNLSVLKDVLQMYADNGDNEYKEYAKYFTEFRKNGECGEYFPVYYSIVVADGEELDCFLSPAAFTREIYTRRIKDIVAKGDFEPCTDNNNLCPACSLFGTLASKEKAVASRLRFSDLKFTGSSKGEKPVYYGPVTLIPLSTPKISNMEFYLEKPAQDALFWTYDYYITLKGAVKENISGINGRKFYWHGSRLLTTNQKSDQNKTIYPVDKGNAFEGELYFDNITETELNRLYYLLNCGEKEDVAIEDRIHCYKLGSAKPAGLGSIAIKTDRILVREYSADDNSYSVNKWEPGDNDLQHLDKFAVMTDFSKAMDIDYPRCSEDGDIFEWFTSNHKGVNRNKNTGEIESRNGRTVIDMPNSRRNEYFRYYLKAMQPEVEENKLPGVINNFGDGGFVKKYPGGNDNKGKQAKPFAKKNDANAPVCPDCKVNKCNPNKKYGGYFKYCFECSQKYRKY